MFLIKHESNNLRLLCHKTIFQIVLLIILAIFPKCWLHFCNVIFWIEATELLAKNWNGQLLNCSSKKRLNDMDKSSQQVYFQTIVKIHSIVVTQPTISYKLSPYHNCKRNNNPPLLYWYDEELRPLLGGLEDICSKSTYLFLHKKRHWKIFSKNFFLALQH